MDVLDIKKWGVVSNGPGISIKVSPILLGLILVGRAAFVYHLSFLSNLARKSKYQKIDLKQQVTIWCAGLMQGTVYNQFTRSDAKLQEQCVYDHESSKNLASFYRLLCQHDIFQAIESQILHSATAQQWTRLRVTPERQKHTPTDQFAQVTEHALSHGAPLLANSRGCLHEAHVWRARFRAFYSVLAHRSRRSSVALTIAKDEVE